MMGQRRKPSDRISVLVISSSFYPKVGGTERQAELQARMLQQLGFDVRVIALRFRRDLPLEEDLKGLRVTRIDYPHWRLVATPLILLKLAWHLIRSRKCFDVVHVHMVGYLAFAATLTASVLRKPIVLKFAVLPAGKDGSFGDFPEFVERFPFLRRLMIWGIRRADRFIAISAMIREMAIGTGLPSERILSIPNAVDPERYNRADVAEHNELRRSLRIRPGFAVVFSGRLIQRKGIADLLNAWQTVIRKHNDSTLYILGEGTERGAMSSLAMKLELGETVQFMGLVENVHDYLRAADLFVLPSHFEGMPNALLEAMACGLPIVATSVSGVMDLVRHGQNGLMVEPGRADRLADAIVQLLEDREMARLMGIEARKTMEQSYSIKAVASAYADLYTQLLKERDRYNGPSKKQ